MMALPTLSRTLLIWTLVPLVAQAQPPITALTFTPDQNHLVAGSQAGLEIRSWPSLETVARVDIGLTHVNDLAFSPNGETLLAVGGLPSEYGELVAMSWPERKRIASTVQHEDVVYSATWIDNGHCLTGSADSRATVWRLGADGFEPAYHLMGHSRRVLAVSYLASHHLLHTAGVDQTIRVWDKDQLVRVLDNHTGIVRDVEIRPGEYTLPYVATAGADRTVRLWQPTIGRMVRFARLPVEPLSLAWSVHGDAIAVGCTDGNLRIVNPNTVRVEAELSVLDGWLYEVVAAPDGSFVVGGSAGRLKRVAIQD